MFIYYQVGEHIFVSGQIGLVPSNNALPSPRSLALEMALSTRHVRRVSGVMKDSSAIGWDGVTQGAIFWLVNANHLMPIQRGAAAFEMVSCVTILSESYLIS
jgi:diphthine-ammonia ligase